MPRYTGEVTATRVADGIVAVDTMMANRAEVTSAYVVEGSEPALVETGPTTSFRSLADGLASLGLGPNDLAHVVVTHIHLDHAGGVGRVAEAFPRATVWVHERGAQHLADPTKLMRSAARVYGEERMRELFGPVEPVAAGRIRSVDEGDTILLGERRLDVLYTPGHASHHICLVDSATGALFTGDALGIHLPGAGELRPATPPPEVDVEQGVQSIERIRASARSLLLFSHFGPVLEVDELCRLAASRLRRWAGLVRDAMSETDDLDVIAQILSTATAGERPSDPEAADRYDLLSSPRMNAAGLLRYWQKRDESA
jgi:glyoxylase-like metal-dependent hydrolase (beta-lactamase superfamily II)